MSGLSVTCRAYRRHQDHGRGGSWARWTAIFFVMLNAFGQIAWMTTYPLWSVLIITLDIIVIYQLTARWEE